MCGTVTFVRHGETYWNKLGIMHGQCDVPLNTTGVKQAETLAAELASRHFDVCYCSPLQRAVTTATEILKFHKKTEFILDDRLMELCKGTFEGRHADSEKLLRDEPLELLMSSGIESKAHFYSRVSSLLLEIATRHKDKNVLIVSHSGTTKMGMFFYDPPEVDIVKAYYACHIKNCGIVEYKNTLPNKKPILIEYNIDKGRYPLI